MQNENLAVALIQTDLFWEDVTANLAALEEKIAALEGGADVLVLPEMFTTGFSMHPQKIAEPMNLTTTRWMQQMAAQTGALVVGSFAAIDNGACFNRLLAVRPDGTYGIYDKRHLFRMGGEDAVYTPGKSRLVVEWKGWKLCPLICYDLRFPVWSRNAGTERYDLLIYVANWPAARAFAWDTLLKARAIENQCYVVGVNRIGADGNGVPHDGGSLALDFLGNTLAAPAGDRQEVARFSWTALEACRERFPVHLDSDWYTIQSGPAATSMP